MVMENGIIALLVGLLLALNASIGQAGPIIYNNGTPLTPESWQIGVSSDFDRFLPVQAADDFSLQASNNVIADIHWWGVYSSNIVFSDDFTIRIFEDDGNKPHANNFQTVTPTSPIARSNWGTVNSPDDPQGSEIIFDIFQYDINIAPIELTSGLTYWLSIVNNSVDNNGFWTWAVTADFGGNTHTRNSDTDSWTMLSQNVGAPQNVEPGLAFQLTTVPEPSILALMGIGLAGIFRARRRKRH